MHARALAGLLTACVATLPTPVPAASLQVSPVSIEVPAPGAAATLSLRNTGSEPLDAQIRVFRWVQVNGEEKLEATEDVVASPPMASLAANVDYTVRLVRVTKRPISAGESYRLLVDELPNRALQRNRVVTLALRYSIPVFFYPPDAADAKVAWSIAQHNGRVSVSAENSGDRHLRISDLTLKDGSGQALTFGNGLAGYVLGHTTMRWTAPANTHRLPANSVVISAQTDRGPINASTSPPTAR